MAQLLNFAPSGVDSNINTDMPLQSAATTPANSPRKGGIKTAPPTPRCTNAVAGSCNVTLVRSEIAEANDKEFVSCTIEEFQSHYLRFLPAYDDVDKCIDVLARDDIGLFSKDEKTASDGAFTAFKRRGGLNEDLTFAPLVPISEVIGLQTFENRVSNEFKLRSCPNTHLKSDIEGAGFRIDACFWREREDPAKETSEYVEKSEAQSSQTLNVSEIVIPMEFKHKGGQHNITKNRRQILSAAHHILHDDARRAWIYGLTIEDNRISLWYFSRSHCVKSRSFSFEKDPKRLVSVLISLQFATRKELGYDERVTRLPSGSYIYEIPQEEGAPSLYFKTIRSIFEQRPLKISCRMTRVWEVVRVMSKDNTTPVENAQRMALKDVWLDSEGGTEAEIQKNLFEDIRRFAADPNWRSDPRLVPYDMLAATEQPASAEAGAEHEVDDVEHEMTLSLLGEYLEGDKFMDLFLAIVHHHTGRPLKEVAKGSWDRRGLFDVLDKGRVTNPGIVSGSTRSRQLSQRPTTNQSTPPTETRISEEPRSFTPKHRCFFVHAQVCECLHDLPTVGEVMRVLRHTLIALRLMFLAGWVHRDVSTGNILAYRSSGGLIGKLGDLEYAKRFPTRTGSSDPKTGTPYFMAVEIRSQHTFYQQPPVKILAKPKFGGGKGSSTIKKPKAFLIHNPQHDLESLWWIILWIITSRVSHPRSHKLASRYFEHSKKVTDNRRSLLQDGDDSLLESFRPELAPFKDPMETVREQLYAAYIRRGADGLVECPEAYAGMHNLFWSMFNFLDPQRETWEHVNVSSLSSKFLGDNKQVSASQTPPRRSERRRNTPSTSASTSMINHSSSKNSFDDGISPRKRQRMDDD